MKFNKSLFGLNTRETNEYLAEMELKLQQEKFEYDEILKSLETECLKLSELCSKITNESEKLNSDFAISDYEKRTDFTKNDYNEILNIEKTSLDMGSYLENINKGESVQYKELVNLKIAYALTSSYYGNSLKEILKKNHQYIETLEEKL